MTPFTVLTEFRFDIGHAVAHSQTLQNEVGKISSAADQAHFALQRVGLGLVTQMGLGGGGLLGTLYTAIKASDKFANSQRQIANIFLSNGMFKGAHAFEDSMKASAAAMENMKKASREFSLPASTLVNTSKLIGATLVSHGLDDSRLTKSTNLARGFLKSAPTLGVDPGLAQGQLLDAVMGRASMQDTLMQRLFNETDAMKPYAPTPGKKTSGGGAVAFNSLDAAKRLDVLSKSLMQFGSNARIVDENAKSMSSQLQRLSDNITGVFSVLKPLGDALMKPIQDILIKINTFIETKGDQIVKNFSKIVRDAFKDPEKLFATIQQLRKLQEDTKSAGNMLLLTGLIHGVTFGLRYLGITLKGGLIMAGVRQIGSLLSWLGAGFMRIGGFSMLLKGLSFLLRSVLAPLAAWTFLFQILSRGFAKAQIGTMKWLAANMERFSALFKRLGDAIQNLFMPVEMAMEFWSDLIGWFFQMDTEGEVLLWFFERFVEMIEGMGKVFVLTLSIVNGVIAAIVGAIFDLANGKFKGLGKAIEKNFNEGFEEMLSRRFQRNTGGTFGDDSAPTSNHVTHVDKIEINNQFKETLEPDRIAFTLTEQLVKATTNRGQAQGRSRTAAALAY